MREQVVITGELALALSRDEFELQYEPQVELCTGRLVGMEALLHWRHPTRGLLMPPDFLSVAEKSGAITGIRYWVIDRACRQMSLWRDSDSAPLTKSMGISYAQIRKGSEFVQFVTDALAEWGVAPGELELGVTEYTLMRATMAQNDVLDRLQELGVRISIEDFGVKCSTFDYLRTCQVSRLRISPSLVDSAAKDADSAAILRAIVGMAHELSIEVIKHRSGTEADKRAPAWADCRDR